jgi:uncharacterized protein (TIGR03000 family)
MALAGSADAPDCHRHGCCGCYGGGGYGGCYGGGYGGCHGGGYGGCYGGGYGGCYGGGYGGCYGGGYGGCYGGGYGGCYGGGMYYGVPTKEMPKSGEKIGEPKKGTDEVSAPGTIVVNLPASARLSIDGYVSKQTTSTRQLTTPTIQPGETFTYTMVAEYNGVQQTQAVSVRAGQVAPVSFNFNTVPTTASR